MSATLASTAVLALVASDVRPAVGETVRLYAAWGGGWPADVAWDGVDTDEGLEATVVPRTPGPLTVRAGGVALTLDVQPTGNVGTGVTRPLAVPLHDVDAGACRDDRYPALAGSWLAYCSTTGKVDRALDLVTRAVVALSEGVASPGLGPAAILASNRGLWRLPAATPVPDLVRVLGGEVGPPATDGEHGAWAWEGHVEAFALTEHTRTRTDADPLPGYGVALAWPWAAWVEGGGPTGEDVWARTTDARRVPLARSARSERHPVGSERWLGWVDEAGVHVQDMGRGERRAYAADTGFTFAPTLWGPVACWEDRGALRAGAGDIDILCSDGVEVRRPGHQRAPSRWGPWLVFREDGRTWLGTVSELILDDDDPRAEGTGATVNGGYHGAHRDTPVSWTFPWPAPGWRVERWDGGAWQPGEALPVGIVTITHPGGDAIRLVPEGS